MLKFPNIISITLVFLTGCFKPVGNGMTESETQNESEPINTDPSNSPTDQTSGSTGSTGLIIQSTTTVNTMGPTSEPEITTVETTIETTEVTIETTTEFESSSSSIGSSSGELIPDPSTVFVTSKMFNGNFKQFDPLTPDDHCQEAADLASVPGTFRAWLSFIGENAFTHLSGIEGELIRIDGIQFSPSFADLINGNITNPLNINEFGEILNTDVWSGSTDKGTLSFQKNCGDWESSTSNFMGTFGKSDQINPEWIFIDPPDSCETFKSLYCFEVNVGD